MLQIRKFKLSESKKISYSLRVNKKWNGHLSDSRPLSLLLITLISNNQNWMLVSVIRVMPWVLQDTLSPIAWDEAWAPKMCPSVRMSSLWGYKQPRVLRFQCIFTLFPFNSLMLSIYLLPPLFTVFLPDLRQTIPSHSIFSLLKKIPKLQIKRVHDWVGAFSPHFFQGQRVDLVIFNS